MSDGAKAGYNRGTYQYCCHIRLDDLHLAVTAYHGLPYLVAWRCLVFFNYDEQRTVPPCHAIGLLIPEDEILEVPLFITSINLLIRE
jgi:hypothetical protein